jgi:rhamnose transport system substrate-binding protein
MRRHPVKSACKIAAILLALALTSASVGFAAPLKIAMVVKGMGNPFFDACRDGGNEAAKALGDVSFIYQGPATPTAEGQIEIIDALIAQKVDGIIVSANDKDALIPITKKAMSRGIKVMSFDSGISPGGRLVDLVPSEARLIGMQQVELIGQLIGYSGEIAILSATRAATNQNAWIEVMKKVLASDAKYSRMKLAAVVYGDDLSDKSYREAMGLIESHPRLKGIISPTTVGIVAACKAVSDKGLVGKVQLTGLGLPSEMKFYVDSGACRQFALWNPIDLGYTATYIVYALIKKRITGKEGDVVKAGRMGDIKLGEDGLAVMGLPYVFNKDNVEKFSEIF